MRDGQYINHLSLDGNTQKKFGVVYTPKIIVDNILDRIPDLRNKAICDPSCGDGQFLVAVVERICKKINQTRSEKERKAYYNSLRKITGWDIDKAALSFCRHRLNTITKKYSIDTINWKLNIVDAINQKEWKDSEPFDYVIGNPPYVRIQHLEKNRRDKINQGDWISMLGCSDLYVLFFEMGLRLLKPEGKLVYITPSSWMKSKAGLPLRKIMKDYDIASIIDFGSYQVFDNVTTYTAITEIINTKNKKKTKVWKFDGFKPKGLKLIKGKTDFSNDGWRILTEEEFEFMQKILARKKRLMDVADINVGIQTLADDVFIFADGSIDIEEEITKRIYKVSLMKNGADKLERRIIYPYQDGKLMEENVLKKAYPKAYKYLLKHKKRLLARDKGTFDDQKWYGFGRDVGIVSAFGEKILTSSMNPYPNFQICKDADSLFYSGYSIKPKPGIDFKDLVDDLNSEEMNGYIKITSRPFRNNWFSYAKSFIQFYPVSDYI